MFTFYDNFWISFNNIQNINLKSNAFWLYTINVHITNCQWPFLKIMTLCKNTRLPVWSLGLLEEDHFLLCLNIPAPCKMQQFTFLRKIGEGGFSRVYEVFGDDRRVRALKVYVGSLKLSIAILFYVCYEVHFFFFFFFVAVRPFCAPGHVYTLFPVQAL